METTVDYVVRKLRSTRIYESEPEYHDNESGHGRNQSQPKLDNILGVTAQVIQALLFE